MNIGIIGGGSVGQILGAGLHAKGHSVTLGIRKVSAEDLAKPRTYAEPLDVWTARTGIEVTTMTKAAAADIVINATSGDVSLAALHLAGAANLAGKILIDVANPLDHSKGFPPALLPQYTGHTSLAEQIQAALPQTRVVKAFNTIAATVMANPGQIGGAHDLFLAGNDAAAKATVAEIAKSLGWVHIVDLGDITAARGTESLLPIWLRLMMTGGPLFNIHVQRA
ncbi:MAG: NAD(P)-binding domain-containing protein [bacterium]